MKLWKWRFYLLGVAMAILVPTESSALTCRFRADFVMKCTDGRCTEGFLAFRRPTGADCSTILDVKSDEPILRLNEDLSSLGVGSGFFSSELSHGYKLDRTSDCLKTDASGLSRLEASDRCKVGTPISLEFSSSSSAEEVRAALVNQSANELIVHRVLFWGFVVLVVLFNVLIWFLALRKWWLIFVLPIVGLGFPATSVWNIYFTSLGGISLLTFVCWLCVRVGMLTARFIRRAKQSGNPS